jgi:hypothetical protein
VKRNGFHLQLTGLQGQVPVLVALTDTSFETDDLVTVDTARGGRLHIGPEKLAGIRTGPLVLQLTSRFLEPARPFGKAKFQFRVEYGIRREMILAD